MADQYSDLGFQPTGASGAHADLGFTPSAPAVPAQPRTWLDSVSDFGKGLWGNLTQSGQGMVEAVKHPVEAVKNIGTAQDSVRLKAEDAFKRGDYAEGVRHVLGYMVPVVGPQIDASGDKAQAGHVAEALGEATGTALQLAAPEALKGVPGVRVTPRITNPNPTEAAALDYLQNKGVPVPAGARTGNAFVKNAQKAADSTPLGAVVAAKAEGATVKALQGEAANLAGRASPAPVVPQQAGAGVRTALTSKTAQHAADADAAYTGFRQVEAQPSSVRTIQTGTKQQVIGTNYTNGQPITRTVPVMEDIPMPVDVRGIKSQLKPIYEDMQKWMEPAKRNASAGFQAMKSILDGPDYIPASQAEAGLGGLKELARDGSGRNAGLAKYTVPKLQDAIDRGVSTVDPAALDHLRAGRAATAEQYSTKAILDDLRTEPVQTFQQMTYAKDAGIDLLRQVQREAPGQMKQIGRAWLEDAFGKAQEQGGFGHGAKLYADWERLGPETKRVLFDPLLVPDLDKFFLGVKKLAENPNPSGTALVGVSGSSATLIFIHPQTGIPLVIGAGAVSKMLHSPTGVRALTNGMKVSLKGPARVAAASQILKMAGNDMEPVSLPAAAQNDQSGRSAPVATAQARQ